MGSCCCKQSSEFIEPNLSHFHLQQLMGQGQFGKVRMVQHIKSKRKFALKYMDKSSCIQRRAIQHIITERNLLEQIQSPMITNLRYCFQDDDTLFLVLDPMEVDLRLCLEQQLELGEDQVRHYVACLAIALDHLRSQRIVHRDIKPENILLDASNYAHLSDFNIAVQLTPSDPLAWTRSGTMAYMAPEMLAKKGYDGSVDWWSLGIVAFELLFGMRPFRAETKDELIHSILKNPILFPSKVSVECMDLIRGLLDKSPHYRLGNDFEKFKSHPWFRDLDWIKLEKKQLPSPCQLNKFCKIVRNELVEDGLVYSTKRMSLPADIESMPVTEEARCRLQLEQEFLDYDYYALEPTSLYTRLFSK